MPGSLAVGEFSYNGYTFGGATHVQVSVEPIYDDHERTVVAQRHRITVLAIVQDVTDLDSEVEGMRRKLMRPGGNLTFKNKGFGDDIKIRSGGFAAGGVTSDINNGPNPQAFDWRPLGSNLAAEVRYIVEFEVAYCARTNPRSSGVMAVNWGASYSVDIHGDTTRVLSGYLQVVMPARATAADTADRYREMFAPQGIPGFHRTQSWTLSTDRRRLSFTITDKQIPSPNAFPRNLTDVQASQRFSFARGDKGFRRESTISMRASVRAGINGAQAWIAFLAIVRQRIAWAQRKGLQPFLESLDIDESIFGRDHSMSVSFKYLRSIRQIISGTGLFQPIGTDWNQWLVSMNRTMLDPRGHGQLRDLASDDVVIDLCQPSQPIYPNNRHFKVLTPPPVTNGSRTEIKNRAPDPRRSWVDYKNYVMPTTERPVTRQSILQSPSADNGFAPMPTAENDEIGNIPFQMENPNSARVDDVIQQGGESRHTIRYAGMAERAGYQIPRPKVLQIGSQTAHEIQGKFVQYHVGDSFGVPVFKAAWVLDYVVGSSPGVIQAPANLGERQA